MEKLHQRAVNGEAGAQYLLGKLYTNGTGTAKNAAEAVAWYFKAAMQGHAPAQCALADAYRTGSGIEKNPEEAERWYRFAAKEGIPEAALALGVICESEKKNYAESATWYRLAAGKGNTTARYRLASLLVSGKATPNDPGEIDALYLAAANGGLPGAQFFYARRKLAARDETSRKEGARWMLAAAKQGLTEAQSTYGILLLEGKTIPENKPEAETWFEKAAANGDPRARLELGCLLAGKHSTPGAAARAVALLSAPAKAGDPRSAFELAQLVLEGRGTVKNPQEALAMLNVSAKAGYMPAQYRLACLYESGEQGIPADRAKFTLWLNRARDAGYAPATTHEADGELYSLSLAASRGDTEAQFKLARRYDTGDSRLAANPAEALRWYTAAADGGLRKAQAEMGDRYIEGRGVRRDVVAAMRYYTRAAAQNDAHSWNAMAKIYESGQVTDTDPGTVNECLRNAAELGDSWAQANYGVRIWNGIGTPSNGTTGYAWVLLAIEGGYPSDVEPAKSMTARMDSSGKAAAAEKANELRGIVSARRTRASGKQ